MPYLKIQTNQSLSPAERQTLLQKASAEVAEQLGKSENYVMVAIEADQDMLFAGSSEPLAYLELKSIGLPEETTAQLSASLCQLLSTELGIEQNRIYIEFANAARHLWGWDGATF
jgi:phenylpyruvate tautomerase PptA (4-oxalocrotonate tautomerase family)